MRILALLIALFSASAARAEWSCVTKEGRLKHCASPARCQKLYSACQPRGEIDDEECKDPRCKFLTEPEAPTPPPPSAPAPKPATPALPPLVPHPSVEKTAPAPKNTLEAQAERKLEEIRKLVKAARAEDSRSKVPGPSGLSPEQEARLFGAASTVHARLAPADRARELQELRANPALREELRRQLASRSTGEKAYDPDATAVLNGLLSECEGPVKNEELKPAEDVFK